MRTGLILVALLALTDDSRSLRALHQDARDRRLSRIIQSRGAAVAGPSYAFFEFAPSSGAGMGAACAGTTPTGAKGELLTFSRASAAYCDKSNGTTGIQNGDLVALANDQPRVATGGSGGLKIGVWESRTNLALRSQEFDNAAWAKLSNIAGVTVTANAAVAPDGTTTAERVQLLATTAGQYAILDQATGGTGAINASFYLKGNGTSGTLNMYVNAPVTCASCSYNATTWTRCAIESTSVTSVGEVAIGNDGVDCGGTKPAQDFFIWQGQFEAGSAANGHVSPPILTTSTSATRVAEVADVAVTYGAASTDIAIAATVVTPGTPGISGTPAFYFLGDRLPGVATGSSKYLSFEVATDNKPRNEATNPPIVGGNFNGTFSATALSTNRGSLYFDGSLFHICLNGTCDSASRTWAAPAFLRVRLGGYSANVQQIDGWVGLVCVDTYASGNCRL